MPNTLNYTFLQSATGRMASDVFNNDKYSLLIIQVTGSFVGVSIVIEARVQKDDGPWVSIGAWDTKDLTAPIEPIFSTGIYEVPIDGISQLRLRIASIAGGSVTVSGVFYDSADGTIYPDGSASIRFGDPALFVKGVAEQIYMDPLTGNIVGYDRTAANAAVTMAVNLTHITGGMQNKLVGVIADTTRISGTYTSEAFSLSTRALIMGGQLAYNAVTPICEKITADSSTLTVSHNPVHSYAQSTDDPECWCYVRPADSGREKGSNYGVNPGTREVQNFYAEVGTTYEVTYYIHNTSAQSVAVPTIWNPVMMTVQTRYAVYGRQGKNEKQGILRGWLYFIVPRAILTANAGVGASQTDIADTDGSWMALTNKRENMPYCRCDDNVNPIAYYVYVPCGDEVQKVTEVIFTGGGLAVAVGKKERLPIKLIMNDDTLVQPDFSRMNYMSNDDSVATVDNDGFVTGESSGSTVVNVYLSKADGTMLTAACPVTVTGMRAAVSVNPQNITVI